MRAAPGNYNRVGYKVQVPFDEVPADGRNLF